MFSNHSSTFNPSTGGQLPNQATSANSFGSSISNPPFSFGNTNQNTLFAQNPASTITPFTTQPASSVMTPAITNTLNKPLTSFTTAPFSTMNAFPRQDHSTFGALNQTQPKPLIQLEQSTLCIPNEVQVVLSQLSNADSRSCQLLVDVFQRLRTLISEPPIFIAFTYEICSSPQLLAQKRAILEETLSRMDKQILETYQTAQKQNPNSSLYAVIPLDGFSGIIERCQIQARSFDQVSNLLQDLKSRQALVRNHIEVQAMERIQSIRHRHERLQATVLDVVETLEDYAIANSVAQLDIPFLKRLKADIATLSTEVNQSAVGRPRLNQCMLTIKDISFTLGLDTTQNLSDSKTNSEKPTLPYRAMIPELTDTTFTQIVRILQKQETMFDNLSTSLRSLTFKSKKLLELLESHNESVSRYTTNVLSR